MKKTIGIEATQKVAEKLAKKILQTPHLFLLPSTGGGLRRGAVVLALVGDLGAGKTTFVQGFASALGIKEKITSPTFLIVKSYKLKTKNYKLFYHIDAYRLRSSKELLDLGFAELLKNQENIIVVEWADKVRDILPAETIFIEFFHGKIENERELIVRGHADEAE
jgi:tRNA threonylcarbamoyladenosine biosynthesis protein TsaE